MINNKPLEALEKNITIRYGICDTMMLSTVGFGIVIRAGKASVCPAFTVNLPSIITTFRSVNCELIVTYGLV
jgi:hypothetical protein